MKRHRWIDILTFSYAVFIVYGSLVPFDFISSPIAYDGRQFFGVHLASTSLPDIFSNIALYLPLGLLARATLARHRIAAPVAVLLTLAMTGVMSMFLELTQVYLATRISSLADVVANIAGVALGAVLYTPESFLLKRSLPTLEAELDRNNTIVFATGWGIFTALAVLMPLDLTFDISLLGRSVRNAYLVPFARLNELTRSHGMYDAVRLWQLRLDYIVDVFLFAVLSALAFRHCLQPGRSVFVATVKSLGSVTAYAVILTIGGVLVMSVGFDSTHLLTRTFGAVTGALMYPIISRYFVGSSGLPIVRQYELLRRSLVTGIALCILYITARELAPFHVQFDSEAGVQQIEWIPFYAYSLGNLPSSAVDALHKSFRYITLGVLLALLLAYDGKRVRMSDRTLLSIVATAYVAVLEIVQCWLPGRIPSVTDLVLTFGFTQFGLFIGERLYERIAQSLETSEPSQIALQPATLPAIMNVEIPPPDKSAPVESIPLARDETRVRSKD